MNTIYTIGHSTRTIDEFIALLKEQGIDLLVDIRRFPGSKRYPHFGKEELPRHLEAAGISYLHEEAFGGRRDARPDSEHRAWRNAQFRGYADHMDTPEFQAALDRLFQRAETSKQVLMCAEAVPWRCHRQLTADAVVARGARVLDIINSGEPSEHKLHKEAQVREDGTVVYPAAGAQMDLL
jgi:uncharacterized protein (DUF488 family)